MKINNVPGEFGFRALFYSEGSWELTNYYFFTYEEAKKHFETWRPYRFVWPVEYDELNHCVYVPSKEELE